MDFNAPVLVMHDVCKDFKGLAKNTTIHALTNLNYVIKGVPAIHAVAGPDGAGKSTFASLVAGIQTPTSGTIEIFGISPDLTNDEFIQTVSYLPQELGLYRELSVWENLEIFASIKNVPEREREKRFNELLKMTGLNGFEKREAQHLSGGMRQKLSLACALVGTPKLLILDEPTVGVDPLSRIEISKIIADRVKNGQMHCLLMTTLLAEAETVADVLFLQNGNTLATGTPTQLKAQVKQRTFAVPRKPHEPQRRQFDREMQAFVRAEDAKSPYLDVVPSGEFLNVLLAHDADRTVLPPDIIARPPNLEDAYCALTLPYFTEKNRSDSVTLPTIPIEDIRQNPVVIRTQNIMKKFGDFVAVWDSSFEVKKGEIFGLLGPNGAGKTTTFRMMCGLSAPTKGEVFLEGKNLNTALSELRMKIGYAAQKFSLYDLLSVEENLLYFGQSYGLGKKALRERIENCLQTLDLVAFRDTRAGLLPLGAQRSLTMAVALINSPDILFLDEPTSGADTASRREFWRRIASLSQQGTTTIVTTHFMEEAEYCDRILIQDAGHVLALGSPQQIRDKSLVDGQPAKTVEQAFAVVVEAYRHQQQKMANTLADADTKTKEDKT